MINFLVQLIITMMKIVASTCVRVDLEFWMRRMRLQGISYATKLAYLYHKIMKKKTTNSFIEKSQLMFKMLPPLSKSFARTVATLSPTWWWWKEFFFLRSFLSLFGKGSRQKINWYFSDLRWWDIFGVELYLPQKIWEEWVKVPLHPLVL